MIIQKPLSIRVWITVLGAVVVVVLILFYFSLQRAPQTPTPPLQGTGVAEEQIPVVPESQTAPAATDAANLSQPIHSQQDLQESLSGLDAVDVDYFDSVLEENEKDAANF
jgi:hypothetical protein